MKYFTILVLLYDIHIFLVNLKSTLDFYHLPNSTSHYLASKRLYRNLKAYKIYFYFRKKFFGQKTPFFMENAI